MICPNINNKKLISFCVLKMLFVGFCRIEAAPLNEALDPYTSIGHLKACISQIYIPLTTSNTLHFSLLSKLSRQFFITSSFLLRNLPLKLKTKVSLDSWKWLETFIHKKDADSPLLRESQRKIKPEQQLKMIGQANNIMTKVLKDCNKQKKEWRDNWENFHKTMKASIEIYEKKKEENYKCALEISERIQSFKKLLIDLESEAGNFIHPELISCFQTTFNTFKGLVADLPFDTQLTVKNKISEIQKILDLEKLDLRTSYHLMEEGEDAMRMFSENYAQPQKVLLQYMESIEAFVIKLTRTFNIKFNELQDQFFKSQKNLNKSLQINKDLERKNEMLEEQADASCSLIGLLLSRTEQNSDKQEILNDLEKGLQCLEEQIGVLDEQLQDTAEKRVVQIFISRLPTNPDMKRKEEIDLLNTPLQGSITANEAAKKELEQERQKKLKLKKAYEEQIFKLKHPIQRAGERGDEIEMKISSLPAANTPVKEPCGSGVFTTNLSTTGASPFLNERSKNSSIGKQQPLKKRKGFKSFLKSLRATRPTRLSSLQKTTVRPGTASDIF